MASRPNPRKLEKAMKVEKGEARRAKGKKSNLQVVRGEKNRPEKECPLGRGSRNPKISWRI